jgi:hypothetical protein
MRLCSASSLLSRWLNRIPTLPTLAIPQTTSVCVGIIAKVAPAAAPAATWMSDICEASAASLAGTCYALAYMFGGGQQKDDHEQKKGQSTLRAGTVSYSMLTAAPRFFLFCLIYSSSVIGSRSSQVARAHRSTRCIQAPSQPMEQDSSHLIQAFPRRRRCHGNQGRRIYGGGAAKFGRNHESGRYGYSWRECGNRRQRLATYG